MNDCCVALHPHPAAIFREEPEVLCRHLALEQNCKKSTLKIQTSIKPRGHYMYHKFNIQQFYVLPTQCVYVFCVDLRTNSDYFPIQH
jgi:hypothetical protein